MITQGNAGSVSLTSPCVEKMVRGDVYKGTAMSLCIRRCLINEYVFNVLSPPSINEPREIDDRLIACYQFSPYLYNH